MVYALQSQEVPFRVRLVPTWQLPHWLMLLQVLQVAEQVSCSHRLAPTSIQPVTQGHCPLESCLVVGQVTQVLLRVPEQVRHVQSQPRQTLTLRQVQVGQVIRRYHTYEVETRVNELEAREQARELRLKLQFKTELESVVAQSDMPVVMEPVTARFNPELSGIFPASREAKPISRQQGGVIMTDTLSQLNTLRRMNLIRLFGITVTVTVKVEGKQDAIPRVYSNVCVPSLIIDSPIVEYETIELDELLLDLQGTVMVVARLLEFATVQTRVEVRSKYAVRTSKKKVLEGAATMQLILNCTTELEVKFSRRVTEPVVMEVMVMSQMSSVPPKVVTQFEFINWQPIPMFGVDVYTFRNVVEVDRDANDPETVGLVVSSTKEPAQQVPAIVVEKQGCVLAQTPVKHKVKMMQTILMYITILRLIWLQNPHSNIFMMLPEVLYSHTEAEVFLDLLKIATDQLAAGQPPDLKLALRSAQSYPDLIECISKQLLLPADETRRQLESKISNFQWMMNCIPKYFVELLEEERIPSTDATIYLQEGIAFVVERFTFETVDWLSRDNLAMDYLHSPQTAQQLSAIMEIVAKNICNHYRICTKIVSDQLFILGQSSKKSALANSFLLFKLLREVSGACKQKIYQCLMQKVFSHFNTETAEIFANLIMQKFENVQLEYAYKPKSEIKKGAKEKSVDKMEVLSSSDIAEEGEQRVTKKAEGESNCRKVNSTIFLIQLQENPALKRTCRFAVSSNLECAIFLKTYSKDNEDYLLKINSEGELTITNCKTLRLKWFVEIDKHPSLRKSDKTVGLSFVAADMLKAYQTEVYTLKKTGKFTFEPYVSIDYLTNTSGAFGKCFTQMKSYSKVSDFFMDLSQRVILTQSVEEVFKRIPVLGYFLMAGSFSYSFYNILTNKVTTRKRKMQQIGGMAITATSALGTSALGAVIGQSVIPIPIVGALIGSVIGGFIGERGAKKLTSLYEKKKFKFVIDYLKKTQIDEKYWLCSKELFEMFGFNENEFYKRIPEQQEDFVFLTMICFVLICFYEGKRQEKTSKAPPKQQAPQKKGQSAEEEFEEQLLSLNPEGIFETEFNIMAMVLFLQEKRVFILQQMQDLDQAMMPFLAKIK